jgi:hypothetical protein
MSFVVADDDLGRVLQIGQWSTNRGDVDAADGRASTSCRNTSSPLAAWSNPSTS